MNASFYYEVDAFLPEHVLKISDYFQRQEKGVPGKKQIKYIGKGLWRLRLSDAARALFTLIEVEGKYYPYFIEYLPTHKYKHSQFIDEPQILKRTQKLCTELAKKQKEEEEEQTAAVFLKLAENNARQQGAKPKISTFYENEFTLLDPYQQQILKTHLPMVLSGVAGSGKSLMALKSIEKYIMNLSDRPRRRVLFISKSETLVKQHQAFWKALPAYQNRHHTVDFISLEYLIEERLILMKGSTLIDTKDLDTTHAEKKKTFATFCKNNFNELQCDLKKQAELIKKIREEFLICSGYDEETYLKLGDKQSTLSKEDPEKRKRYYQAYQTYLKFLEKNKLIDPDFFSLNLDQYDLVVMDEAQDLSPYLINAIHARAENNNILYCMDSHQRLNSSRSVRPYLLNKIGNDPNKHISLVSTYRCPPKVVTAANKVLAFKQEVVEGLSDKYETPNIQSVSTEKELGSVYVCDEQNLMDLDWIKKPKQAYFVVITSKKNCEDPVKLASLKAQFKTENILSPEQAKGLEYDIVLAYDLYDEELFNSIKNKTQSLQQQNAVESTLIDYKAEMNPAAYSPAAFFSLNEEFKPVIHQAKNAAYHDNEGCVSFCNEVYTSYTRAKTALIICEKKTHLNKVLLDRLTEGSDPGTPPEDLFKKESTKEDWEAEIIKQLQVGNENLAKNFYLHIAEDKEKSAEEFDVFIKKLRSKAPPLQKPKEIKTEKTVGSVDNCSKTRAMPTFRGLSAESMDPVDKPQGVGLVMKCQQTLEEKESNPSERNGTISEEKMAVTTVSVHMPDRPHYVKTKSISIKKEKNNATEEKVSAIEPLSPSSVSESAPVLVHLEDPAPKPKSYSEAVNSLTPLLEKSLFTNFNEKNFMDFMRLPKEAIKPFDQIFNKRPDGSTQSLLSFIEEDKNRTALFFKWLTNHLFLLHKMPFEISSSTSSSLIDPLVELEKIQNTLNEIKLGANNLTSKKPVYELLRAYHTQRTHSHSSNQYAATHHRSNLQFLVDKGADLSQAEEGTDLSLIHLAASLGDIEALRFFHTQGLNLDQKSNKGDTPLSLAIKKGAIEAVAVLLEKQVNFTDSHYLTLDEAKDLFNKNDYGNGLIKEMQSLIQDSSANKYKNESLIPINLAQLALGLGHEQIADLLKEKILKKYAETQGFQEQPPTWLEYFDIREPYTKNTPLPEELHPIMVSRLFNQQSFNFTSLKAVLDLPEYKNLDRITTLDSNGSKLSLLDYLRKNEALAQAFFKWAANDSQFLINIACEKPNSTDNPFDFKLQSLLKIKEVLNSWNDNTNTKPIHALTDKYLEAGKNLDIIPLINTLYKLGADLTAKNEHGCQLIHWAAEQCHLDLLKFLHQKVDFRATSFDGMTAAHIAARLNHTKVFSLYKELALTPLLFQSTKKAYTPMHILARYGFDKALSDFVEPNFNIDAVASNYKNICPSHIAAQYNKLPVLKKLKELQVDLDKPSTEGTPLSIAITNGYDEIADFLISDNQVKLSRRVVVHLSSVGACSPYLTNLKKFSSLNSQLPWIDFAKYPIPLDELASNCDKKSLAKSIKEKKNQAVCQKKIKLKDALLLDTKGTEWLHYGYIAAYMNDLELLQDLYEEGVDLTQLAENGYSIAHFAAQGGHVAVLQWIQDKPQLKPLLTHKAALDITPSDILTENHPIKALEFVANWYIGRNLPSASGKPLRVAAQKGPMKKSSQNKENSSSARFWAPKNTAAHKVVLGTGIIP